MKRVVYRSRFIAAIYPHDVVIAPILTSPHKLLSRLPLKLHQLRKPSAIIPLLAHMRQVSNEENSCSSHLGERGNPISSSTTPDDVLTTARKGRDSIQRGRLNPRRGREGKKREQSASWQTPEIYDPAEGARKAEPVCGGVDVRADPHRRLPIRSRRIENRKYGRKTVFEGTLFEYAKATGFVWRYSFRVGGEEED